MSEAAQGPKPKPGPQIDDAVAVREWRCEGDASTELKDTLLTALRGVQHRGDKADLAVTRAAALLALADKTNRDWTVVVTIGAEECLWSANTHCTNLMFATSGSGAGRVSVLAYMPAFSQLRCDASTVAVASFRHVTEAEILYAVHAVKALGAFDLNPAGDAELSRVMPTLMSGMFSSRWACIIGTGMWSQAPDVCPNICMAGDGFFVTLYKLVVPCDGDDALAFKQPARRRRKGMT